MILRGANDYMLDEMERALHDALCIVKRTLESNTVISFCCLLETLPVMICHIFLFYATLFLLVKQVVAGGGAVESALSVYLEHLATTLGSREQLAIAEFADALLIIPKVRPTILFHQIHRNLSFSGLIIPLKQVLAVNAAKDATELVAKLRAYHHTAQTKADKKHYSR